MPLEHLRTLLHWRSREDADALDPLLRAMVARAPGVPGPDAAQIARAQARVPAALRPAPTSGRLRRRLALATAGGGGTWFALASAAAAHKAATAAVAVSLLVAGGATLEATGVGADVREAVGIAQHGPPQAPAGDGAIESTADGAGIGPGPGAAPGAPVGRAPAREAFTVSGVLIGATEHELLISGPGGDTTRVSLGTEFVIELPDGAAVAPATTAAALDAYARAGSRVQVEVVCAPGAESAGEPTCEVMVVRLLDAAAPPNGSEQDSGSDAVPTSPPAQPGSTPAATPAPHEGSPVATPPAGSPEREPPPTETPSAGPPSSAAAPVATPPPGSSPEGTPLGTPSAP